MYIKWLWCLMVAMTVCGATCAETVCESAREIPVYTNVDVLVVGGSVGGVAAARSAAKIGARVFLAAPMTFLGEDMAGTLRLKPDGVPKCEIGRRLFTASKPYAKYVYVSSEESKYPYNFVDPAEKLAEPTTPTSAADTLQFKDPSVTVTCKLEMAEEISRIEVTCMEYKANHHPAGLVAELTLEDGRMVNVPSFECKLAKSHFLEKLSGPWVRGVSGNEMCYSASVGERVVSAKVTVQRPEDGSSILLSRIRFVKTNQNLVSEMPTPLKVKQVLDHALMEADISFLTGMMATDLVKDDMGDVCGVIFANRSGRQAILARRIVDATQFGTLGRLLSPRLTASPGGRLSLIRRVLAAEVPHAEGLKVTSTGCSRLVPHMTRETPYGHALGEQLKASFYDAEFELPAACLDWPGFAAAECDLQAKTFVKSLLDGADVVRVKGFAEPKKTMGIDRLLWGGCLDSLKRGSEAGRSAARTALGRSVVKRAVVSVGRSVGEGRIGDGDVREFLAGIRSFDGRKYRTILSPARRLPVLGRYDVVVVGGGTSGAPAAIAAARGAKTLVVEYLHSLGGIHTESLVCGYYYGNVCGCAKEISRRDSSVDATVLALGHAELFRRMVVENGGDVWFGTMGVGAYVERGKVAGVVVATPFGRGVVLAKCVVDGTGNADVCAQAGAQTSFLDAREFVLMSAGFCPHRLGSSSFNTDLGYVNDSDVADAWLFGLRARAGAPEAWDFSQLPATRERRRVISDRDILPEDVVNGRRFPDTISQSSSVFDSHRLTVADLCFLSEPQAKRIYDANIPYRAVLPRGVTGVAAVGLGFGADRDVLPVVRMQADLINLGYAVGMAAALAAENGGDYRRVDVRKLQRRLIAQGALRKEVLDWRDDHVSDDKTLAAAVDALKDHYRGIGLVLEARERAVPLLRLAYGKAEDEATRYVYAIVLGMMGDRCGLETLMAVVDGRLDVPKDLRKGASYGDDVPDFVTAEIALGRIGDRRAIPVLLKRLKEIGCRSPYSYVRGVTLALGDLADPEAAAALEAKLNESWVGRNAVSDPKSLPAIGGYAVPPETEKCLIEISLSRALLSCGDPNGTARRILESYQRDARGCLSLYAARILGGKQ